MTDNRTTELLDGLRHVGNLHEFAELFGFDWHDDSDWTWHDVAVKMADDFEQAIAITLGRGECELHECEGSFSALNRPVWRCDCGAFMTQYTDATTYHKPRFCPNCGRKAVKR